MLLADIHLAKLDGQYASSAGEQKISWTSGTGDITETAFKVNNQIFYLDLVPRKNGKFINNVIPTLIVHNEEEYKLYRKNN